MLPIVFGCLLVSSEGRRTTPVVPPHYCSLTCWPGTSSNKGVWWNPPCPKYDLQCRCPSAQGFHRFFLNMNSQPHIVCVASSALCAKIWTTSDFNELLLPPITAMATYHETVVFLGSQCTMHGQQSEVISWCETWEDTVGRRIWVDVEDYVHGLLMHVSK